jgi:hypothetical protein
MKTKTKILSLALILCFVAFGCNKDNSVTSSQGISNDEAADEVAASLSTDVPSTDVVTMSTRSQKNGRQETNGRTEGCGTKYDTTINKSYTGAYISFSLSAQYSYSLTCSGAIPSSLNYSVTSTGSRNGVRLQSQGATTGNLTISGFEISKSIYSVNGSMTRTHSVVQKSGAQRTFNGTIDATLANLQVDKSTKAIKGGTASLTASGTGSGGASYSYTANAVFNGDGTATVTIGANVYSVNLQTGQVTKQ